MLTVESVRDALAFVREPEFRITNIQVDPPTVYLIIETSAVPASKEHIKADIEKAVKNLPGVSDVAVSFMAKAPTATPAPKAPIKGVKHVIAVYACKGGVGKSTISTNLAVGLASKGARIGLLDADVHGPNIPLMMGKHERPAVSDRNKITPLLAHGVKFNSLGLLKDVKTPMIWRGPMVHGAVQQLLRDTEWGDLDYLVIDMPPGTGDAQLTVIQSVPLAGVVVVTTPQAVSLLDGDKGIGMFQKLNVPILGVVENMSGFECAECHHVTEIFSQGGGEEQARRWGIPFLGRIPLDPAIVQGGDTGQPLVVTDPQSKTAQALLTMAERTGAEIQRANPSSSVPV